MNKEELELLESMVDGYIQAVVHEFNITEEQAVKLIKNTLEK